MFELFIGTVIVGFVVHKIFTWYTREPEQEDALLIDVACQTSPVKRIDVNKYYKLLNEFYSSSDDSEDLMNIEFCASDKFF